MQSEELLRELSTATLWLPDDPRVGYVVVQIGREEWDALVASRKAAVRDASPVAVPAVSQPGDGSALLAQVAALRMEASVSAAEAFTRMLRENPRLATFFAQRFPHPESEVVQAADTPAGRITSPLAIINGALAAAGIPPIAAVFDTETDRLVRFEALKAT